VTFTFLSVVFILHKRRKFLRGYESYYLFDRTRL
jgi:hypothetical protein